MEEIIQFGKKSLTNMPFHYIVPSPSTNLVFKYILTSIKATNAILSVFNFEGIHIVQNSSHMNFVFRKKWLAKFSAKVVPPPFFVA